MAESKLAKSSKGFSCVSQGLRAQVRIIELVASASLASKGRAAMQEDGYARGKSGRAALRTTTLCTRNSMHPAFYALGG